jgi:DNA-binding transcriptional LysR family regulator
MGFIPQLGAGFYQQGLFLDHYVCMARKGHPHINPPLTLEKYRRAAHAVVSSEGTGHGERIERTLQSKHIRAKVALRVTHFLAVPSIVARTDLAVVLPTNLAESFSALKVRLFALPFELPAFEVKQYWHERYHFDPAVQWLRKTTAQLFMR